MNTTTPVTPSKRSRPLAGTTAPNRGVIENAPVRYAPEAHAAGSRAVVTSGDLPEVRDEQMNERGERAGGREVEVLGDTYVSLGGPNKGQLIEQVRDVRTGQLMGVPTSKLRKTVGERSAVLISGFREEPKNRDQARAAEARRADRWEEYAPGRYRLRKA